MENKKSIIYYNSDEIKCPFCDEIFYKQKDKKIRESIDMFFMDVFDFEKAFTQSDLDLILTIYKNLDKNMRINIY